MDAFFEQNRAFILSTLYLMAGILIAGYSIPYQDRVISIADVRIADGHLKQENKALQEKLDQHLAALQDSKESDEINIHRMPSFLRNINHVANANNVVIYRLEPSVDSKFKFNIEIREDYRTFLRFAADLESLNAVIHDLQVRPHNAEADPPTHVIHFSLTPRNDAEQLKAVQLVKLKQEVNRENLRNPFQRFAYQEGQIVVKAEIDLTWIYKLTSIGKNKEGRYATIDKRDYYPGDDFFGKTIVKVQTDFVELEESTRDGTQRYVMHFRIKK